MRRLLGFITFICKTLWLSVGGAILVAIGLEVSLGYMHSEKGDTTSKDKREFQYDKRELADAYNGASWVQEYYKEFIDAWGMRWESFVYWRRQAISGQFVNVSKKGIRHSWSPRGSKDGTKRIFVFGGSAVWGTGARDDYTIPSLLAQSLDNEGLQANVINYGESGYILNQELFLLMRELQRGHVPDIVVFYDGVNDTYSYHQNGEAGIPLNEENRRKEFNMLKRLKTKELDRVLFSSYVNQNIQNLALVKNFRTLRESFVIDKKGRQEVQETVQKIMDEKDEGGGGGSTIEDASRILRHYAEVVRQIRTLSNEYGFKARFFWQPAVFFKKASGETESSGSEKERIRQKPI